MIDGNAVAARVIAKVRRELALLEAINVKPTLAVVLVGENAASKLYVEKKRQMCEQIGIGFELRKCDEKITELELKEIINELNYGLNVSGILVQLPLPPHLNQEVILGRVSPLKDVDGFNALNLGMLFHGESSLAACTAKAIIKLIEASGAKIEGSNVCIVNHSIVVGKPLALMLLHRNATVTVCHKFTKDLAMHTRQADILVTAVGKPGLIKADMVKQGAIVIDAGISSLAGKAVGDVDFDAVSKIASFITPVPGGVGPMTVACLMENTVNAALLQQSQKRH
ncbi:MAG: bifunctional 5,10-methylenetetrahydrofolate dehydrogenase/5,10-methenyltetrahydrofolate cyclohydrolase [Candidatus Diapherotrites archaeon]|nr:bifunctional 5,10-methylenetetrahydrofolate dehydrogenase/5,10-methenyltetrahydrofolate cyclohydrolase [Candidatus Diapherotrites archaeon]